MSSRRSFATISLLLLLSAVAASAQTGRWVYQDSVEKHYGHMDLDCADSLNCMAIGTALFESFDILKSTDGGRSWRIVFHDTDNVNRDATPIRDISYPTPNTAVAGCDSGYVLTTTDGGETWSRNKLGTYEVVDVAMYGTTQAIAAILLDTIIITFDGGASWKQSSIPSDQFGVRSVSSPAPGRFFVLLSKQDQTMLLRSDDSARTWQRMASVPFSNRILFVDSMNGWMSYRTKLGGGELSRFAIWRTWDGGRTWTEMINAQIGNSWSIMDMKFADTLNGLIADESGQILRTRNGGRTWTIDSSDFKNFGGRCLDFLTLHEAIAMAGLGFQLRYIEPMASVASEQRVIFDGTSHFFPNPVVGGTAMLSMNLDKQSDVEISITDALGHPVLVTTYKDLQPGDRAIHIDGLAQLIPGTYLLRAFDGRHVTTMPLIVLH